MQLLKQSTAATVVLGPFVDDTDGKTAETGLTIAQADIRLSKNGAAFAQTNNSAGATHMENGYYSVPLDTTDTGTLGRVTVAVSESGALPVWREFHIVPANTYDSIVSGSDYLQVDAHEIEGSDATDQINAACDTALTDYDAVIPADLPTNFGDLAITATTGKVTVGTNDDKTGYSISGTKTTLDDLNDVSAADVNAQCDTALTDYDAPTKTEMDTAFTEIKGATWSDTTDTLEHIRNKQTDIETDTQDLQTQIGTDGNGLTALPWNASWDAEVQSECIDALNAYDPPTKAELDSGLAGLNDPTAVAIREEIDSNSTQLAAIVADTNELQTDDVPGLIAALNDPTAASIADAVWDEASSGHNSAGTLGEYMRDLWHVLTQKMEITEANGNTVVYESDGSTTYSSITAAITSDGTDTVRKAMT